MDMRHGRISAMNMKRQLYKIKRMKALKAIVFSTQRRSGLLCFQMNAHLTLLPHLTPLTDRLAETSVTQHSRGTVQL